MILSEVGTDPTGISHVIECLGANISLTSFCESTALHFACGMDCLGAVKVLLENGAEIGVKNTQRKTEKDLATNQEVRNILGFNYYKLKKKAFQFRSFL